MPTLSFVSLVTITSCLKTTTKKNLVTKAAILNLSLGQMAQVRDTIAKNGSDSVYTANLSRLG